MEHLSTTHRSMTSAEQAQIEAAAIGGISPDERLSISAIIKELFPSELGKFNAKTRASLNGIMYELAQDHPNTPEYGPLLSNAEYLEKARYILRSNESTLGDKELYQFQMYFNTFHDDGNDIGVDGVSGTETIKTITSHVNATQVFLKELGADVHVNATIDDRTKAAIKEYFGFDIASGIAVVAVESVVAEIDRIQSLSDTELLTALEKANENQPDKLSDKRAYIAEFIRRYKEDGNSIVPDSNNRYTLVDISGNTINTALGQQDLQSMMVLLATNGGDIFNRDLLKENIANNMFDHVVETYDFKKSNGRTWQGTDFVSDSVRTEAQVQKNKTACVGQIEGKINGLRNKNKLSTTTVDQKKVNILAIQKLEIAKIFVEDQTRLGEDALVIARSITENRVEIARALGTSEEEITRAYNQIESGDWKDLAFSMIGPGILALIFGFLSRLIPEGAMRTAFNASIVGLLGITAYNNAQEMGLPGTRTGSTTGRNAPNINTPEALQAQQDIVRSILTAAPKGLESRHKDVYVKIVQLNNEPGKGYFDDRLKLDTTYLALSQDPVFAVQGTSDLSNITEATAFEFVDASYTKSLLQGQGVTGEELMSMIKMLVEVNGDSEDTKAQDLFIAGQVTDTLNNSDITWVQGESFESLNLNINKTVSEISGISFGADESLRSNSVRAKVEEALAKAQPNTLAWMGQAIADRTNFIAGQEPTAANIGAVIVALKAITAAGNDDPHLQSLISMYENIQETLSLNEGVYAYLSEAKGVYTYIGATGRLGNDVITWVQGWGDTIPTNPNAAVTTDSIQVLIASGITHAGTLNTNPDLQKEVLTAIENLRLYQIKMFDDAARATSLTPTEKADLLNKSDEALAAVIAASPEVYMTTLDNLETELSGLKNTYTNTDAYLGAFAGKKEALVTLQRLTRITTGDSAFDTKAATVYSDVYTAGFATNFKTHLSTKITGITSFNTTSATLADLNKKQKAFDTLRNEVLLKHWVVDLITYFGTPENTVEVSGQAYLNVPDTMNDMFKRIDSSSHTAITFDKSIVQVKQTELDAARLDLEGSFDVTITPLTDSELENRTKMSRYVTAVNAMHTQIKGITDDTLEANKLEELKVQVSDVVDRLTEELKKPIVGIDVALITPIVTIYSTLITNELGDAGNATFKNTLERKYRDIEAADYETMLDETTFGALQPETSIFITTLKEEYHGKYSLLDIQLELIVDPNATLRDITETLTVISSWDIDDMGNHESGSVFDATSLAQYVSAVNGAKSGVEGAISSNEVRARMARTHGGLLVMLEGLGII